MSCGPLSRLARVRFTVGYLTVLVSVSITLVILGPQARAQAIAQASTNLHNLAQGKVGTLLGSALVIDGCPMVIWLPGLVALLAVAELFLSTSRLTAVFLVGHVGATLLVALGLVTAIGMGWLPVAIAHATDVGMSYGAIAVLGALTAAVRARWRPAWMSWWLALALVSAVIGDDFTDVGHAVALILGMVVAARCAGPARWTPVRYLFLVVASAFGFLLLVHTGVSALAGLVLGATCALAGHKLGVFRRRCRLSTLLTSPLAQSVLGS